MAIIRSMVTGIALFTAGASQAEVIQGSQFSYGNWNGAAYTNDTTGQFSHCAISAPYVSGDDVTFSVNRQSTVSMGVSSQALSMPVGTEFPVAIFVDRKAPFYGTATVLIEGFAVIELPDF